ncbi:unnamed protein product [Owenia fusiformis]|uniref:Uncharacterized protein n=1 Tax=Owenia fusiformis TaxID=6347 RepID=A0A8J1THQ6_OWEFU|nr:unnamed protein product [Owenia fusiformis]
MAVSVSDAEVDAKINEWLRFDKNEQTRGEILRLVEAKNVNELRSRLCNRMAFGTAGLRARMGAGYSMMNDLTIIQTAQGLAKYLLKTCEGVKKKGIVIGYDARHNSQKWGQISAGVMLNEGIPVYLFSSITPTPFVPYSVVKYGCSCGVMVTASHNPKEDNGYKVYWENGAQIIPPHDKGISTSIIENLTPLDASWVIDSVLTNPLLKDPLAETSAAYFEDVKSLCHHRDLNMKTSLKFTYTAMHGVGYSFAQESFKSFGFQPLIPVELQVVPDPEFPTVKFPNPEEGKSALDLSIKTANENDSTVILANDPDADRLAVAEKLPSGDWHVFTGNEVGALLGWWSWHSFQLKHPEIPGSEVYMLASTVSSKILKTIATSERFNFEETLTGFKWMGNKAVDLMKEGKKVLFAFEEAIGFMCGTEVLDKDGVSALSVIAELAVWLVEKNSTLKQQLDSIYQTYGLHISNNSYFICHHQPTIDGMFNRLRNFEGTNTYPKSCGPFSIKYVRDLTTGFDNERPGNQAVLPTSKSSQMITFTFDNGCIATMRTSGTEPKIKYYTEICGKTGASREDVTSELNSLVDNLIEHFMQPNVNKLIARSG